MAQCRYFYISPKEQLKELASREEALAHLKKSGYLWLDFHDPAREELSALIGPLGLHPLAVEDCLDQDQIPKIEDFPGNTFILFNTFAFRDRSLAVSEVDFFLGEKYLLTVHGRGDSARFYDRITDSIQLDWDNVRKGPDHLLHVFLDYTVDRKLDAIEALQEEIDAAEEIILQDAAGFNPENLLHRRRDLLLLRKSLFHEREILVKICRKDSPYVAEGAIYHFRDIYDHLTKFFEVIEIAREMITSLMEMYLSMINNQMARVANRTNRAVRRLTLITTIFMPLTLLAGIGGMSEWTMMTGQPNWKIAYPAFLLAMIAIGIANYLLLRWLDSGKKLGNHKRPG